MHIQHDLSLTVIALIVIYLIGHLYNLQIQCRLLYIVYLSLGNVNDLHVQATN